MDGVGLGLSVLPRLRFLSEAHFGFLENWVDGGWQLELRVAYVDLFGDSVFDMCPFFRIERPLDSLQMTNPVTVDE